MPTQKDNLRRNIRLDLMYDGTNYLGWQRLTHKELSKKNIQGLMEETIEEITGEEIRVIGSGRTDAGVHALQQVCNFYTNSRLDPKEIKTRLNSNLPEDIKILRASYVDDMFHARYDAKKKIYEYRFDIRERESVFHRKYSYFAGGVLDLKSMQKAAGYLIGTHDFRAFSTDRNDKKSTIRSIDEINIYPYMDGPNQREIRIECTGGGFLYHMVRIIAGTLYEVGKGLRSVESVLEALNKQERRNAGILLDPHGLYLKEVIY